MGTNAPAAESRHLKHQVTYARPIFLVLAIVDLLETGPIPGARRELLFVSAYLGVALLFVITQRFERWQMYRLPLVVDLAALAGFYLLSPPVMAMIFLYL